MFNQAIVRKPCAEIVNGLTSSNLGTPNYDLAIDQHAQYCKALESCGLRITVLEPDSRFPDSTFVEDTALITPKCAIITNPGAPSRKGETEEIKTVLKDHVDSLEAIEPPGNIEAGDIMMVDSHYYIGLSERTNEDGARQMITILDTYGLSGSVIKLEKVLHLKTGVSYLENNILLAAGEFIANSEFQKFTIIPVDDDESYAANSIWVNNNVIMPYGNRKTQKAVEEAGYNVIPVDTSEFRKIDGGVSCLSLRF
jgi:dimethylargininase